MVMMVNNNYIKKRIQKTFHHIDTSPIIFIMIVFSCPPRRCLLGAGGLDFLALLGSSLVISDQWFPEKRAIVQKARGNHIWFAHV